MSGMSRHASIFTENTNAATTNDSTRNRSPIESRITILRSQKIILDTRLRDLRSSRQTAQPTSEPQSGAISSDFMFQITRREFTALRLQFEPQKKEAAADARFLTLSPSMAQSW